MGTEQVLLLSLLPGFGAAFALIALVLADVREASFIEALRQSIASIPGAELASRVASPEGDATTSTTPHGWERGTRAAADVAMMSMQRPADRSLDRLATLPPGQPGASIPSPDPLTGTTQPTVRARRIGA